MVEILAPYAAIISAGAALISVITTIYVSTRKTPRDRIEKLKEQIQVLLSREESPIPVILGTEIDSLLESLNSKYKTPKYNDLRRVAFNELVNENKVRVRWPTR